MRRLLAFFLMLCLIGNICLMQVYATNDNHAQNDDVYNKAINTLIGLNLIKNIDMQPSDKITRAEFADVLTTVLGWKNFTSEEETQTKKFLGYTNDPVYEDVEGWIWDDSLNNKEELENDVENLGFEEATPFRDVLTTHEYWSSIRLVASFGLMSGDDNKYFRPNDYITLIEAEKVLLYACGRGTIIGENFPAGVLGEVAKTRLDFAVEAKNYDDRITYRDAIVLLYNALDINVYESVSYFDEGVAYKESDTETLLSHFRDIYLTKGIVTQNRTTGLKTANGTADDTIVVDDNMRYKTNGKNYNLFLGKMVDIYYTVMNKNDSFYTIVYLRDRGQSKELVIDADDIQDYKNNKLTYYSNNSRLVTEYIGADTDIIYNGKALNEYTDYGDKIITPKRGTIRFVDAKGDGKYDTVFIDDIRTVVVSAVDGDNKYIYDRIDKKEIVDLSDCEYVITDKLGTELTLGDISINSVLDVRTTLKTQGEPLTQIAITNNPVIGSITHHNLAEKEIIVNDSKYVYTDSLDKSFIVLGSIMTFYLNSDDEVVWATKGTDLTFVFLTSIGIKGAFEDEVYIRVYDLVADEFFVYELAEKVVINKSSAVKAIKIKDSVLWDSVKERAASQLIKIKLNADGKVVELMSEKNADGTLVDENEMVEVPFTPCEGGLLARTAVGMLADMYAAVAYFDSNTVYNIVPLTEFHNDEGYYKGEAFEEGKNIKANKMYKAKKNSALAAVVLLQEDTGGLSSADKQVITDNAPSVVTEIVKTLSEEGDICYEISGVDMRSTATFTHKVVDEDLMTIAADLEPGDMIQFTTVGQYKYMQRMKKVFDSGDMEWTKNYGGGTKNPVNRRMDYFDGASQAIHGRVSVRFDDGAYIKIAPYVYDKDGNTGIIDEDSEYSCIYPTKLFKYYVYDKKTEEIRAADVYADLFSEEEAGYEKGSEVIAWTNYGQPRTVIIYK